MGYRNEISNVIKESDQTDFSAIVTLAEAKKWCFVSHTDDDIIFPSLIASSIDLLEEFTNTSFYEKEISVTMNTTAFEGREVYHGHLPYGPVIEITGVEDKDGYSIEDTQYQWRGTRINGYFDYPVTVTYIAGYETIPAGLKTVLLRLIFHQYENRGTGVADSIPLDLQKLASPYKRFFI